MFSLSPREIAVPPAPKGREELLTRPVEEKGCSLFQFMSPSFSWIEIGAPPTLRVREEFLALSVSLSDADMSSSHTQIER